MSAPINVVRPALNAGRVLRGIVSFGLAPALISYNWGLSELGKIGWLAAFIYTAAGALRLARFNIQTLGDKRFFTGLPIPAAAAVVAGIIWFGNEFDISGTRVSETVAVLVVIIGILMVSRIPYYSFKEINFKDHVPFMAMLIMVLLFSVIAWNPPIVLFLMFFLYTLSGPLLWFRNRFSKNRHTNK